MRPSGVLRQPLLRPLRVYMVAGEPSGDALGGALLVALRNAATVASFPHSTPHSCSRDDASVVAASTTTAAAPTPPSVLLRGVGGEHMLAAGLGASLFPLRDLSVMGWAELLPALPRLAFRLRQTLLDVEAFDPDVVVTIDSKGFNFRLVRLLRSRRARRERRQRWHSGGGVVAARLAAPATAAAASAAAATATAATAEIAAAAAKVAAATDTSPRRAPRFVHYVAPSAWAFADGKKRLRALMGQDGVGGRGGLLDHVLLLLPFEPHFFARVLGRGGDGHEGEGRKAETAKDSVEDDDGGDGRDGGFTFVGHPAAESGAAPGVFGKLQGTDMERSPIGRIGEGGVNGWSREELQPRCDDCPHAIATASCSSHQDGTPDNTAGAVLKQEELGSRQGSRERFRHSLSITDKDHVVLLLPGSRPQEIQVSLIV